MSDDGDRLETRLAQHFGELNKTRGNQKAVFALEHGLDALELEQLRTAIRAGSSSSSERSRHPLLWVVHATEIAYDYEGDEYWQSFASATPGWDDRLRSWIRDLFSSFATNYGGPKPTGPWASWFSIIAWPITNAVLPTDLQRHLARALFQARSGLRSRLDDIQELGRFIASAGGEGSDRYNQLRDQPALLGQIALALLRPADGSNELLLEATLRRIASDLAQERASGTFLRGAQRTIERTEVHLGGPRHGLVAPSLAPVDERVRDAATVTSPRLVLRPGRSASGSWAVWLQLPDLSPIAAVDPTIRDALQGSRCWAPSSDTPVARGRLLQGAQELSVVRWPDAGTPLLRFQGLAAGLESALLGRWAAPTLPALFGVRGDGRAAHVVSRGVRAGRRYVVAHGSRVPGWDAFVSATSCSGVIFYALDIPLEVPEAFGSRLPELGVKLTRTSRVWPAGVVPVEWDGEAAAQWLTNDAPILGISPDHDLRKLVFTLGNGLTATKVDVPAGSQLFAVLPRLPVGVHRLIISEEPVQGPPAAREISVSIREPRVHSLAESGPIRLWVEPYSRSLAELWDGAVAICINGPVGMVSVSLALGDRPRAVPQTILDEQVTVPVGPNLWRSMMAKAALDDRVARTYDGARWGIVEVRAGRFGTYSLEFERSLPPLRWRARSGDSHDFILVDDTADGLEPRVTVSTFGKPDRTAGIEVDAGDRSVIADNHGGLYVARLGANQAAIIAPPRLDSIRSFEQLRLEPEVEPIQDVRSAVSMLDQISLWAGSPLPGSPIARAWRATVVRSLHDVLVIWICGPRWMEAERFLLHRRSQEAWVALRNELSSSSPTALRDARRLADMAEEMVGWPIEQRIDAVQQLVRTANLLAERTWPRVLARRGSTAPQWVAELWLRLATDSGCATWLGDSGQGALEFASEWVLPIRVARCLALWSVVGTSDPPEFPPLFEGWSWR